MVKSFKEFIGESTWGKMLDRGAGDAVRKEDDVNHLLCSCNRRHIYG